MPRVTVVIPAYNGAQFIGAALESLLAQTRPAEQIIVVNDGSEDETAAVLQAYAAQICIINQPNLGVAAARNRGLAAAEGEFVAFLDQDDLLLPNKLKLQVDCLAQHPTAGLLHSGWRLVDEAGQTLSDVEPWRDLPVLDAAGWIRRMPVLFSAMLFRRDWLMRVGGLSSRFKQVCDVELVQRLVLAGCESIWLPQITVLYRQHSGNDSRNTLVQAAECWAVQDELFARPDLPLELRQLESESRYYNAVWIAWRLYHTQRLAEMTHYLEIAFRYRPGTWTEAMLQWIELFKTYEASYGKSLDLAALIGSAEWQAMTAKLLKLQAASS
ncbi:MAG: glycosyltransferase [Pegethrix bostrychoides GSE-TBD4-15B]|uniref:Glycosyltransferase n=1 Tax=Pegethrix bostrychoides GSE-TBD4-15B TaxID=2839662 RepID=A0A951PA67_9CYAN|nr:glycosyltransferase [Pegethrix bostrychoides GSE-TBD4-15B]